MRSERHVAVVSDTHLGTALPAAVANWHAAVAHLTERPPDVVVHAGDLTADAASRPDDLDVAAGLLADPPVPIHVVPGNHDVGDRSDPLRLARFRAAIGPDRWSLDLAPWAIVGINAQLLGTRSPHEADQDLWLTHVLAAARHHGRHVVLVLHKPLHAPPTRPGDADPGRYAPATAAGRFLEAGRDVVRVVVTGHTHQYGHHARDGITHVWAPSTWATFPDHVQPVLGEKSCGLVELTLGADGHADVAVVRPPHLHQHVVDPHTVAHLTDGRAAR